MLNLLSTYNSVGLDLIRTISATFDKAIYSIISFVYEIILQIANISVFDPETIGSFSNRIYTLIGIFMLFKLSISLITYIINPDSVFDKEKGGTKLIRNIVISFILIIMMPTFFTIMNDVQNAILTDHVIENFIFGNDKNNTHNKFLMDERCYDESRNITGREITKEGDYIALLIFRPFFQIDPSGATDIATFRESYYCNTTTVSDVLQSSIYNSPNSDSVGTKVDGYYDVDYWFIISSLVGGAVALILVGFAMDVAVRSIKISFLQIVSPIAIISYIDPSQSKNGMLMKWAKELGKTWADLFIRLIALYLVILIVTMIDTTDMLNNVSGEYKIWAAILIIIGGLIFAKKLPSLIGNLLGIKLDGGFTINPLKKLEKEAIGSKAVAATGGMLRGTVGGAIAGGIAGKNAGNIGKGIVAGMLNGANYGRQNVKGAFGKSMDNAYKSLTGNEMARLDFTKLLMGGGKEEVGQMKDYLKMANEDLRKEETRLSVATHTSSEIGTRLRGLGIDLDDLDVEMQNLVNKKTNLGNSMNSARLALDKASLDLSNFENDYLAAKTYIEKADTSPLAKNLSEKISLYPEYQKYKSIIDSYDQNKKELSRIFNDAQKQFENATGEYKLNNNNIKDIEKYLEAIKTTNESRAIIQAINKTITTLADEKKQREKFYRYDSSPREDVNSAIKKVDDHKYN